MIDRDTLRRFVFDDFPVRGQIVHLDESWQAVLQRHQYPGTVQVLLGEAIAATVLLASTLKFSGRMTLQIQGDGPLNLLVVQCTDDLKLRGLARWQQTVPAGTVEEQFGTGRLAITIATNQRRQPYQGIVPLTGDTLSACLAAYFESSEQLATRIWLAADSSSAAGLVLQQMPEQHETSDADEDWQRIQLLSDTLNNSDELLTLAQTDVLYRLFHEDTVRLHEPRRVDFRCSCSQDRIETMLQSLGRAELDSLIAEQGKVSVVCEFCNKNRDFDVVDVERLLAGSQPPDGSDSLH